MRNAKQFLGAAMVLALGTATHAAITDELPGNLFRQTGAPYDGNVSIAINNPQNMGGGSGVMGPGEIHGYPIGDGQSPALDGDVTTGWDTGTFGGGGMLNFAMTQGYFRTDGSFENVAFSKIGMIRLWMGNYINEDQSSWQAFPEQLKIAYTTAPFPPGDSYSYNSNTLGITPGDWNTNATILSVNGAAPTAPSNSAYDPALGWVNLADTYITTPSSSPRRDYGYVDLVVDIPEGATSVLISLGQINSGTGNPGGAFVADIQAVVPEPASLGVFALAGIGLLARRRPTV